MCFLHLNARRINSFGMMLLRLDHPLVKRVPSHRRLFHLARTGKPMRYLNIPRSHYVSGQSVNTTRSMSISCWNLCSRHSCHHQRYHTCVLGVDAQPTRRRRERRETSSIAAFLVHKNVQSTGDLNDAILHWRDQKDLREQDFEDVLHWLVEQQGLDATSFELLLQGILSYIDENQEKVDVSSVHIAGSILENYLETIVASSDVATTPAPSTEPLEFYFHRVMKACIWNARDVSLADQWLSRWWYHHEASGENVIPRPTPKIYALVMSAWCKVGQPHRALSLLQDMEHKNIQPQIYHFETCLKALLKAVRSSKGEYQRNAAYDAENLILQMNRTEGLGEECADTTGRSWQTRTLSNLNKVVQCWVDSRQNDAAVRATAILDLMEDVLQKDKAVDADWEALGEAYSHAIRAWSFVASARDRTVRKVLAAESDDYEDPALYSLGLLLRLETILDSVGGRKQAKCISLKIWRRIYGSVILAFGRDGSQVSAQEDCQHAREVWDRFRKRKYGAPDIALYNHLFNVFGKMGCAQASEGLWQELRKDRTCVPDIKTYNWRLLAYGNTRKDKNTDRLVKYVWYEIHAQGLSPDITSYNTYISCLAGTRDLETAQEVNGVFLQLLACRNEACRATLVSLNSILRMWSIFAENSDVVSEREEALRSVLDIIMEIHKLRSRKLVSVRPDQKSKDFVSRLLKLNGVTPEKQLGVMRLLDEMTEYLE